MKVLIVDDDQFTLHLLEHALVQLGHSTIRARCGQEALDKLNSDDIRLVITDWDMPGMSGIELCRAIRNDEMHAYIYLIMLSGRGDAQSRREGLGAGADDFLFKPLDADDLTVCFKTAERILALETRDAALFALAKLAESRDPDTGAHVERVQTYTRLLARHLSPAVRERHHINPDYIRMLYQTSALHDLGKVGIPDRILLKPGKLSAEEFEVMKTHATLGSITLDAALHRYPNAKFLRMARDIAASHHERFDGSGYPAGLSGDQIPMSARLVSLADVYDALTSRRVYKEAITHEVARQFILASRGRSFDPDVVDAFVAAEKEFIQVRAQVGEQLLVPTALPAILESSKVPDVCSPTMAVEGSASLLRAETNSIVKPDPKDSAITRLKGTVSEPPTRGCILSMDAIIEQCGGDRTFALGIIERFKQQAPIEIRRLDDSLIARDVEGFRRAAHTVKSMVAYVEANVAAEQCRQLEELARANCLDGVAPLLSGLHYEIESIIKWIDMNGISAGQIAA